MTTNNDQLEEADVRAYEVEALQEELNAALNRFSHVVSGIITPEQGAWWLCANHRFFVALLDETIQTKIVEKATNHGSPPSSSCLSWEEWIDAPPKR